MNYRKISLETIPSLHFTRNDVLHSPYEKRERVHDLVSATALTVIDHEEIRLVVRLDNGENVEVISNLIEYGGDYVELKGGHMIPLRAILKVEI